MGNDIDPKTGMTADEKQVMDRLMEAYAAFLRLAREHPDEIRDFVDGVHRCQDVLAVRICRRIYPQGWPTYGEKPDAKP